MLIRSTESQTTVFKVSSKNVKKLLAEELEALMIRDLKLTA